MCVRGCVLSHSCVRLCGTPWTVTHQAALFMEFSRQEYWNGLPRPHPGDLPNPRIEPTSPALAGGFFTIVPCLVAQLCLTLCNPMDYILPGSLSIGILQARILESVTWPSSRGSSWPRDWTQVSHRWILYHLSQLPLAPLKHTKENLNKWRNKASSWFGRLSIVKMSFLPSWLYTANAILITNSTGLVWNLTSWF